MGFTSSTAGLPEQMEMVKKSARQKNIRAAWAMNIPLVFLFMADFCLLEGVPKVFASN
jgi:hypothetical protein